MPDLLREITSCAVCTFYICVLVVGICNVLLKQTIILKKYRKGANITIWVITNTIKEFVFVVSILCFAVMNIYASGFVLFFG